MRSYTTLGSGRSTKVLFVADHQPACTVTTTTAEVARKLAVALSDTLVKIPAALYKLAVDLDGTPVEARRRLLSTFDTVCTGGEAATSPLWEAADELDAAVASAVVGQPAAVIAAVRAEVADHLGELDGVLVPARAVSDGSRRAHLDLVVSGPLGWLNDSFWSYMLGPHGDLTVNDDDALFPLGGPLVGTMALHDVRSELWDAEPVGYGLSDMSMIDLVDLCGGDDQPDLLVRGDHLVAWVRHHRPQDLDAMTAALT